MELQLDTIHNYNRLKIAFWVTTTTKSLEMKLEQLESEIRRKEKMNMSVWLSGWETNLKALVEERALVEETLGLREKIRALEEKTRALEEEIQALGEETRALGEATWALEIISPALWVMSGKPLNRLTTS